MNFFVLLLLLGIAVLALAPLLMDRSLTFPAAEPSAPDTGVPGEPEPRPPEDPSTGEEPPPRDSDDESSGESGDEPEPSEPEENEPVELPFDPIHTFDPDEDPDPRENPWPELDPQQQHTYDDRQDPDEPSRSIQEAVDWVIGAHTEAIHQQSEYDSFIGKLTPFIEFPRAVGAERIGEREWRNYPAHMSRCVADRLIVMALGLSAQGPVRMDAHRDALEEFLEDEWNDDGLERPLVYQCLGRLALLTPTRPQRIQDILRGRIPGRIPRSPDPTALERVHFHALILSVCPSRTYPFPRADNGLSRLWHWDGHNPPLVTWPHLLPVLYALWIHYWIRGDSTGAANDFGSLLGSWWNEHTPSSRFLEENPGVWEAILMTAWALVPDHPMIWDKIRERFETLRSDHPDLKPVTDAYFEWVDERSESGEIPPAAFPGHRFPPTSWIQPLPTDVLVKGSQPSFNYSHIWGEEFLRFDPPKPHRLRTIR